VTNVLLWIIGGASTLAVNGTLASVTPARLVCKNSIFARPGHGIGRIGVFAWRARPLASERVCPRRPNHLAESNQTAFSLGRRGRRDHGIGHGELSDCFPLALPTPLEPGAGPRKVLQPLDSQ